MANQINDTYSVSETRRMFGRKKITTDASEITRANVVDVLRDAMKEHQLNQAEISYLYDYYKGKQPILNRQKTVRPEINNQIVENRANEIVSFKVGYLCGEPIQYVSRNGDEQTVKNVQQLNDYMLLADKQIQDQQVIEWQMICGTAYRLVLPRNNESEDEAPFELSTCDPRNTFVVYSSQVDEKPMMAVKYYTDKTSQVRYSSVYTDTDYFLLRDEQVIEQSKHFCGMIPLFEYPANNSRLGAFEIVLPLLDAINKVESNRLDGVEQIIQAFYVFTNCSITKDQFEELKNLGALQLSSIDGQNAKVEIVKADLDQNQTQTLKDDYYNAILTICGMPNRHGGKSTSDTGSAVLLRDGWSLAEARAKDSETMFKRSEKQALKLILKAVNTFKKMSLKLVDIDIKFTRRNYDNMQSKAQVLLQMLGSDKIHPQLAFQYCGMFSDPESAYAMSNEHYQELMDQLQQKMLQVREDDKTREGENPLNRNDGEGTPKNAGENK